MGRVYFESAQLVIFANTEGVSSIMKRGSPIYHIIGILGVAMLVAGCSGGTAADPSQSLPQSATAVSSREGGQGTQPRFHKSWMAPDAKKDDLLYVSDPGDAESVFVYSWPQGQAKGTLTGFDRPSGLCVDGKGNVFVTNLDSGTISEFAHGGTSPIATLSDPDGYPNGCSYDKKTGNLAVTNLGSPPSGPGSVAIYNHASGSPKYYTGSDVVTFYFCGYDNRSNLFVDGEPSAGSGFAFAELPKGKKTFTNLTLNQSFHNPAGVQWDGKYLAVGDAGDGYAGGGGIYEFSISGSTGTEVGSTPLSDAVWVGQFWIQGKKVAIPNTFYSPSNGWQGNVLLYKYPAGGTSTKTINGYVYNYTPDGATVSLRR